MSSTKHIYFKNLDSLRFFAALFVILGHCQYQLMEVQNVKIYEPYTNKMAVFGVDFFFTLSGFLINYILLTELFSTGTIQVKNFFMRRFLRIWPIYFIFGLTYIFSNAAYFLNYAPAWQTTKELLYNLLHLTTFSINIQILIGTSNYYTPAHYWSLSVEEQYYFIWVFLLLIFRRYIGWLLVAFISMGAYYLYSHTIVLPSLFHNAQLPSSGYFFTVNHFYHFTGGASLAWLLHIVNKEKWLHFFKVRVLGNLYALFSRLAKVLRIDHKVQAYTPSVKKVIESPYLYITLWILIQIVFLCYVGKYLFGPYYPKHDDIQSLINGPLSVAIIFMAISRYSVFFLENPILKYGGKISFGMYIFHIVAIKLSYISMIYWGFDRFSDAFYFGFPIAASALSIGFATLSYEYIEKYFLKLKTKFR